MTPDLSIIIPAFNESARLPTTLRAAHDFVRERANVVEMIVVDDGSTDDTSRAAEQACPATQSTGTGGAPDSAFALRVIRHDRNRGKGAAVRTGLESAHGELALVCDADGAAPFGEFGRLRDAIAAGADIAIGSRDAPGAQLAPAQPLARRWAALAFRAIRRQILLPGIRDTQCGFKLFRIAPIRAILPHARCDGWLGDVELLALAERFGLRIDEVGITWSHQPQSHVRPLLDAPRVLLDLLRIRRRVRAIRPGTSVRGEPPT
ncbi:MAG: glycosyltransferase [Planctomycetia bacterium]|nr:MAG: glycosyltransferase [Planctomycetia bacterium]